MSNILVIQPHKMLQHALVLALSLEHKVRLMETLPDASTLAGVDAVIIDAAALMEKGGYAARDLFVVDTWQTPTLWIDEAGSPPAPKRDRLVILQKPVHKDALQKALAECLKSAAREEVKAPRAVPKPKSKESKKSKEQRAAAPVRPTPVIIELVEVVEDAPAHEQNRTPEN